MHIHCRQFRKCRAMTQLKPLRITHADTYVITYRMCMTYIGHRPIGYRRLSTFKCISVQQLFYMYLSILYTIVIRLFISLTLNSGNFQTTCQAPLSLEFSRQEYRSGLPFPSPGDLSDPGIEPGSLSLLADSLPSEPWGKPCVTVALLQFLLILLHHSVPMHRFFPLSILKQTQMLSQQNLNINYYTETILIC